LKMFKKILINLITVLLTASIIILGYLSVQKYITRQKIGRNLKDDALQAGSLIDKTLLDSKEAVVELANEGNLDPDSASPSNQRTLEDFCRENSAFLWALVAKADGEVVSSSNLSKAGEDFGEEEAFKEAMKGENWITDIRRISRYNAALYLSTPLFEQDKIMGALVAALDGEALNNVLSSEKDYKEGKGILVDENGEIIASAKGTDIFKYSISDYRVSQSALSGSSGYVLGTDTDGEGIIIGYAPVNNEQQWTVLTSSPYNDGRSAEILGLSALLLFFLLFPLVVFMRPRQKETGASEISNSAVKPVLEGNAYKRYPKESQSDSEVVVTQQKLSVDFGDKNPKEKNTRKTGRFAGHPDIAQMTIKIIREAVFDGASDVHVEPHENGASVRYRIDGILHSVAELPEDVLLGIVPQIKTMAKMDLAEDRIPQNGRARVKLKEREIDLRISTFPTIMGEKCVLKILDQSAASLHLEDLGFSGIDLRRFRNVVRMPSGLVIVAGPAGSGKTTTLYATLNAIKTTEKNIVTLEDPVEYRVKGINQGEIRPAAGQTYAKALNSVLRQDPDIIMVGEIDGPETAEMEIQASLAGRTVLSSLPAASTVSTLTWLQNMGIKPFEISASASAVVAQRLIRTVCPKCREEYIPSQDVLEVVNWQDKQMKFEHGRGCSYCMNSGFRGRTALFELLLIDKRVGELIVSGVSEDTILSAARQDGMKTLLENGLEKVKKGITTLEELITVTRSNS